MRNKKRLELMLIEDVMKERLNGFGYIDGSDIPLVSKEILDILVERGYLNED